MNNISQIPKPEEIPYLDYAQIFTASSIMYDSGKGKEIATFDVTVREMPGLRNFLLLGGIEEMVNALLTWKYEKNFVSFLLKENIISASFASYLKKFRFKGDVWAMPEGTAFFPGEPIIRVTTSLSVANLLTAFLVNVVTYPTLFLSKVARVKLACRGKPYFLAGAMRAFSFESIIKVQRLSYVIGSLIAMPYVPFHFHVAKKKAAVGFYHALIKAFANEKEAYRHFLPYMKGFGISTSMVDTYDVKKGIDSWIKVEKEARAQGQSLGYVSIDSGDIYEVAGFLRKQLDEAGLRDTKIVAYGNLEEFKINKLEKKGASVDMYCPVTEVTAIADRPVLEAVYKLAETVDQGGKVTYQAKLSPGKMSLPGKKQVYRKHNKKGKIELDTIGLADEKLDNPLLTEYIKRGKLVRQLPTLDELKMYVDNQILALPDNLKSITKRNQFSVKISQKIDSILEEIKRKRL